jgi:hypothetical protein
MTFNLEEYVDVKTRVALFWAKYPEGSIVTSPPLPVPGRDDMIYMVASIYADQLQERLIATGTAAELVHGKTPYTKDSEVQNLETSAIGRSIANANLGIIKGMASLNEVVRSVDLEEARKTSSTSGRNFRSGDPLPESKRVPAEPVLDAWGQPMEAEAVQMCVHGAMTWKEGIGKTGKPYSGWVCDTPKDQGQCPAQWN